MSLLDLNKIFVFSGTRTLAEVAQLLTWCRDNNLSSNSEKTEEMIIDPRKRKEQHASLYINGNWSLAPTSARISRGLTTHNRSSRGLNRYRNVQHRERIRGMFSNWFTLTCVHTILKSSFPFLLDRWQHSIQNASLQYYVNWLWCITAWGLSHSTAWFALGT